MASDWVSRCNRSGLFLACFLSVACGKITSPGGQATSGEQRDTDETPDDRPPPSMSGGMQMDDDPPPRANDDDGDTRCNSSTVAGLSVTIGSPDFECDEFSVVATDADYEERLSCSLREDRCRCFGVHERPGTYTVTVEAGDPPEEFAERQVVVELDDEDCHVETESVSLRVVADDGEEDAGVADAGAGDPVGNDAGN